MCADQKWQRDGSTISTDKRRLDLGVIHGFLRESSWAHGVPHELVVVTVRHPDLQGLRRFLLATADAPSIRDVILFPLLKTEKN